MLVLWNPLPPITTLVLFLKEKNQKEKCRHWFKYTQGLVEYVAIYRPFQWFLNHAGKLSCGLTLLSEDTVFLIVHSLHACIIPWIVGVEMFCYVIDFSDERIPH